MNLWQWLISPQGIPVLVAMVGVLSGLIGGGVSQLIAGAFKAYGDTRQINAADRTAKAAEERWVKEQSFQRERWEYEQRLDREKLTREIARDTCLRLLRAHADIGSKHLERQMQQLGGRSLSPLDVEDLLAEVRRTSTDLLLFAPSLQPDLEAALHLLEKTSDIELPLPLWND